MKDENKDLDFDMCKIQELLAIAVKRMEELQDGEPEENKEDCVKALKKASEKTIEEYMNYAKTSDYESAYKLSRQLNIWAKKIKKFASKQVDFYLYMMGFYNATFSAYKNSISRQSEEAIFTLQMSKIINRRGIKEILQYLYCQEYVQNKNLCMEFSVAPNLLHKRLKVLIDANCVIRYSAGKYAYYSLSDFGKKYAKNILGCKEEHRADAEYGPAVQYTVIRNAGAGCGIEYKQRNIREFPVVRTTGRERGYEGRTEVLYARNN